MPTCWSDALLAHPTAQLSRSRELDKANIGQFLREAKADRKAARQAERLPELLTMIAAYPAGEIVSKASLHASTGWTAGLDDAVNHALAIGLLEIIWQGRRKRFRRTLI